MTPIREHARELITAQADEGLRNLRAQLEAAKKQGDAHEVAYYERRIAERKRFLARLETKREFNPNEFEPNDWRGGW